MHPEHLIQLSGEWAGSIREIEEDISPSSVRIPYVSTEIRAQSRSEITLNRTNYNSNVSGNAEEKNNTERIAEESAPILVVQPNYSLARNPKPESLLWQVLNLIRTL